MIHTETKTDKSRSQVFHESTERLSSLLLDHPHFRRDVSDARMMLGIPENGLGSVSEALVWKQASTNRNGLHQAIDTIVEAFAVPLPLRSATYFFVADHVLMGRSDVSHFFDRSANLLRPSGNIENDGRAVNAYGVKVWVGIDASTTERDLRELWRLVASKIPAAKKFGVPAFSEAEREAWRLQREGRTSTEISKAFRKKFPGKSYTYANVTVLVSRYRKALARLRPLK